VKNNSPLFEPYDDDNIEHVEAGPDYGQSHENKKTYWSLESSPEYLTKIKLKRNGKTDIITYYYFI